MMTHKFLKQLWTEDDGVLSFEWVLLGTLLTLGIISGIAGARDAIIDELGDIAEAALAFDQTYSIAASTSAGFPESSYSDTAATYADCSR